MIQKRSLRHWLGILISLVALLSTVGRTSPVRGAVRDNCYGFGQSAVATLGGPGDPTAGYSDIVYYNYVNQLSADTASGLVINGCDHLATFDYGSVNVTFNTQYTGGSASCAIASYTHVVIWPEDFPNELFRLAFTYDPTDQAAKQFCETQEGYTFSLSGPFGFLTFSGAVVSIALNQSAMTVAVYEGKGVLTANTGAVQPISAGQAFLIDANTLQIRPAPTPVVSASDRARLATIGAGNIPFAGNGSQPGGTPCGVTSPTILIPTLGTSCTNGTAPAARYFGSAKVNGVPAADGRSVQATIGGVVCGVGTTSQGQYVVDIQPIQGCTTPGATVLFTIGGLPADQTGTLPAIAGTAVQLNLTAEIRVS